MQSLGPLECSLCLIRVSLTLARLGTYLTDFPRVEKHPHKSKELRITKPAAAHVKFIHDMEAGSMRSKTCPGQLSTSRLGTSRAVFAGWHLVRCCEATC